MALRPAGLPEPEPISPELVLVSSPEVAQRAREELREPRFWDAAPAVRERLPEPPARREASPPPQPPRRRRLGRVAAAAVALAAIAAAVAYMVARGDNTRRVGDPAAASAPPTSPKAATGPSTPTAKTSTAATAGATRPRRPHAATGPAPRRAARTSTRASGTAPHAATPKPSVEPKHAKPAKQRPAVARASGFVPARTWTWPASSGARAYVMRLLLNGSVVLQRRTSQPRLVLPQTFRFRAGTYRWLVERIPPPAHARPIVDSKFVLTRAVAARANG